MKKSVSKPKPAIIMTTITDKYALRFLSKLVEKPDTGCLIYEAGCSPNGYGQFWDGYKSISAHRFSYQTFVDDLPVSGVLKHSCNNKRCAAWFHLTPATHAENSADASRDGLLGGKRRAYRKMTGTELADIRARAAKGETHYSISKLYDRGHAYISQIVSGKLHPIDKPAKPKKIVKFPRKPTTPSDDWAGESLTCKEAA